MRYFIVCYSFTAGNGGMGLGTTGIDGSAYPNRQYFSEYMARNFGHQHTTITNIIEVSKQDYEQFLSETAA